MQTKDMIAIGMVGALGVGALLGCGQRTEREAATPDTQGTSNQIAPTPSPSDLPDVLAQAADAALSRNESVVLAEIIMPEAAGETAGEAEPVIADAIPTADRYAGERSPPAPDEEEVIESVLFRVQDKSWLHPDWSFRIPLLVAFPAYDRDDTVWCVRVRLKHRVGMQSDFADVRFTGPDGATLLTHSEEEILPEGMATMFVPVDREPGEPMVLLYVYYGNKEAASSAVARDEVAGNPEIVEALAPDNVQARHLTALVMPRHALQQARVEQGPGSGTTDADIQERQP
jgi:hypothetical protein